MLLPCVYSSNAEMAGVPVLMLSFSAEATPKSAVSVAACFGFGFFGGIWRRMNSSQPLYYFVGEKCIPLMIIAISSNQVQELLAYASSPSHCLSGKFNL